MCNIGVCIVCVYVHSVCVCVYVCEGFSACVCVCAFGVEGDITGPGVVDCVLLEREGTREGTREEGGGEGRSAERRVGTEGRSRWSPYR